MEILFEVLRNMCLIVAGGFMYAGATLYGILFIFGSLPFDFLLYYYNKRRVGIPPMSPIDPQWTWPDTPAYQKAYREGQTELAKTRKSINRMFLYLGIALVFALALIVFGAVYYSIHK